MNSARTCEIEVSSDATPPGQTAVPSERPFLSIVIPVRDAAGTLPQTLQSVTRWIADAAMNVEVIVIDDGSTDGTRAAASAFARRIQNLQVLRHVESRGLLESIRTGERAASGSLIAFGREVEIAASLEAGADLITSIIEGADVAALPLAPERLVTPIPPSTSRKLSDSCRDWLRRAVAPKRRDPALLLCRASALRRMTSSAEPADCEADPDWLALARRARCALSLVRRGSAPSPRRLLAAPRA